jgi:bifunctional non-homologous end joining protein LigD
MQATQVKQPFHRDGWVYEEIDGWWMLAYKDGRTVRLESRKGVDHTRVHDLATAVAKSPARTLALDGEVAIFDRQLRSRLDWLRDPDPEEVATPPRLMVFDLLYSAGRDQTKRPLRERRARLAEIVAGAQRIFSVRRLTSNGLVAWGDVLQAGSEGYVAKDEARPVRRRRH